MAYLPARVVALRFRHKVAIVTGAGIGDVSVSFAEEGARRVTEATAARARRHRHPVNNTADFSQKNVKAPTAADWDKELAVNVIGSAVVTRFAIPHLKTRGGVAIVNVASISGLGRSTPERAIRALR
ncbi:MAG: SDR family NAD(P)-dependent oxidoreductase [Acidobacteria bacterium]|nr:SDR family NAD(P)-dependent oxidoreductase [Acidobacteriota bacterium]